jgi:hypothetical protein
VAIKDRILERTVDNPQADLGYVFSSFYYNQPEAYGIMNRFLHIENWPNGPHEKRKAYVISSVDYALLPAISLPFTFREPIGVIVQSMIMFCGIGLTISVYYLRKYRHKRLTEAERKIRSLSVVTIFGFFASISWLVLAQGHALNHPHLNGIVFCIPFLPLAYILIWSSLLRNKRIRRLYENRI